MRILKGFLIISVILIYSCGRCDKEHTYLLTDKAKSYFANFAIGDMWIFKNTQGLGFVDTLILKDKIDTLEFSYTETKCDGDFFEIVNYQLISKVSNDTIKIQLKSGPNIDIYSLKGILDNRQLNCYLDLNKKSGNFDHYTKDVLNIVPEYELNSIKYFDVVDITFNQFSPVSPEKAPRYFYAKNIGLIEFEIYNESTNNRINYSLIKLINK